MKTGYKVGDVMTQSPITISAEETIKNCAKKMIEHDVESLVVKKGKELAGIITDIDIVEKIVAKGKSPDKMKVKDVMVTRLITITPEKDIFDGLDLMRNHDIRQLPVVSPTDRRVLSGYITMKDILKIQPSLFDVISQEFNLREEKRKFSNAGPKEGICHNCGKLSEDLKMEDSTRLCADCREE